MSVEPREFSAVPRARLILAVLLIAGTVLIALDSRGAADAVSEPARAAGDAVFTPLAAAVSLAATPVVRTYDGVTAGIDAQERITELEQANGELAQELADHERDTERADALAELLELTERGGYEVVAAQAVARVSARGHADAITLDVGERDGVTTDMTVVSPDGLVGRISETTAGNAEVLLVTDTASAVGARMEGDQETGVVHGNSDALSGLTSPSLRFELLDATAAVQEGDRVVSLGSHEGTPFVPGVPIGTVKRVEDTPGELSRLAELRPAADLSRLDVVGVVVDEPDEDPRDAVLPDAVPADLRQGHTS